MQTSNKINAFRSDYYFLSNFYECPVTYEGITYQNNEAAFQAQKCKEYEDRKMFSTLNASEAKRLGRRVHLRSDWEQIKIKIMKEVVTAKFKQHPELMEKLIETYPAYLEEGNTWGDKIWGTVDGKGANNLGKILMETREELMNQERQYDLSNDELEK